MGQKQSRKCGCIFVVPGRGHVQYDRIFARLVSIFLGFLRIVVVISSLAFLSSARGVQFFAEHEAFRAGSESKLDSLVSVSIVVVAFRLCLVPFVCVCF